jgi:hypothetical protein
MMISCRCSFVNKVHTGREFRHRIIRKPAKKDHLIATMEIFPGDVKDVLLVNLYL